MAKRKLENKLIDKSKIKEELRLIKGSKTDYITPSGEIYKDYGNNKFFHKSQWTNWGYWYCGITYPEGQRQRRVHILVAEAYIPNPNNSPYVLHIDDNKENKHVSNLKWGTPLENTQDAVDACLLVNDKGWEDSQSIPISVFDLNKNHIKDCGSVGEASKKFGVTKTGILYQCNHKLKTKPRKNYYFRYYNEYKDQGFVL